MRFVLDASVTLSWLLWDTAARDEAYPLAALNALRDPDTVAMVPTQRRPDSDSRRRPSACNE